MELTTVKVVNNNDFESDFFSFTLSNNLFKAIITSINGMKIRNNIWFYMGFAIHHWYSYRNSGYR